MKKTTLSLCLSMLLLSTATANAADMSMTQSLFKNVIIPDVNTAKTSMKALRTAIKNNTDEKRSESVDKAFTEVVKSWKAVQAVYIAGELDGDMIDTPRLMDTYHEGNEDLDVQITRAVKSGDEPRIALFKNTFKSINALGILLYKDSELTQVERQYADYVLATLSTHLDGIAISYKNQTDELNEDQEQSMSFVLNSLIDSSFKLKEWRLGEASGLAKKYSNKPDNRRQEYLLSGNSINAMLSIVTVHDNMIGERDYVNLGSAAIEQGAKSEVAAIRQIILSAMNQLVVLQNEKVTDFSDPRIKKLYLTLSELNDAYYQSLVQALPVQAKILDADGD